VGFAVLAVGLVLIWLPPPLSRPFTWLGLSALVCGVGVGIAGPPANNAAVQLMPDKVAAISGLRAMFRQTGGIIAITLSAVVVGGGPGEGTALGRVFLVFAVLTVLTIPAILRVPERRVPAAPGPAPLD
jgi:MFS family permease